MDDAEEGQAFAIPDWWKPSTFTLPEHGSEATLFGAVNLDVSSIKLENPYAPTKPLEQSLQLPSLDTFAFGPLPDLEPIEELSVSNSDRADSSCGQNEDDIWKVALDLEPLEKDVKYYTWELFIDQHFKEPCSSYISDHGAFAFDALLLDKEKDHGDITGNSISSRIFLSSLISLSVGLESILFSWDKQRESFQDTIPYAKANGLSHRSTQALILQIKLNGNTIRNLRSFSETVFASNPASPAKVALASSVRSVLAAVEIYLLPRISSVGSLLQMQGTFDRFHTLMGHLMAIVTQAKTVKHDVQLVSLLYNKLQALDQEDGMVRLILLHVVARVCAPSLESLAAWTCLGSATRGQNWSKITGSFVEVESQPSDQDQKKMDEYIYKPERMPSFITEDDGLIVFEIGKSIRMLQHHHPQHPLSNLAQVGITPPSLEWKFGWDSIESVTSKASAYESNVTAAVLELVEFKQRTATIQEYRCDNGDQDGNFSNEVHDLSRCIPDSLTRMNALPQDLQSHADELQDLVHSHFNKGSSAQNNDLATFAPPVSVTPLLSFQPLFATQARLVNAAILRVLFRSHDLRTHLSLQWHYHLLGDGVFISRLTSSLFDAELSSAERQRGSLRLGTTMGIRLTGRKTWPPASSELRLALMGLLSETYALSSLKRKCKPKEKEIRDKNSVALPGDLSFAIRQLSPEEIEKCMNPQSFYALDFLRLQYTAPSPLHTILTQAAMDKYDNVFKFLLRLTRMIFVISHLPRNVKQDRKLRTEAHHFVNCCAAYFFDGVRDTWDAFEKHLDVIEAALAKEDESGVLGKQVNEGIESLRAKHERVLDQISFKLLLRGRQRQVMVLLEEIFEIVLEYAGAPEESQKYYPTFREKVQVFLTVCRGLVGKTGYGKTKSVVGEDENTIERLVLAIEMNGYYATEPIYD